jgi:hypothetical protein
LEEGGHELMLVTAKDNEILLLLEQHKSLDFIVDEMRSIFLNKDE